MMWHFFGIGFESKTIEREGERIKSGTFIVK